ncbi:Membrane protein implicated in regulation of membrane protease activity [Butyrivibrio sp. YAB3001]|nr:Membrane protein implicated in regulation of membrane protease activity [Butyrivibrio sp. YAB3001]
MVISAPVTWLIVTVALAVIELSTFGLVTIWFAIGAAMAMIAAIIGANIGIQLIVFIVVSTVILITLRPLATKYVNSRTKRTNIDAVIGRKLVAKTDIDNAVGLGKVDMDGSTWFALSSREDEVIHAGDIIRVVKVVGAKLIVEKEDEK